ncbi:helix-turn-helix domain-containing protein, partial [Salmonella enterica]|uniref:helix-turn-helix domain-containing protein n=1 Tax=Salmonella enterica TaxID=28901 RepID=UPI0020C56EF1
YRKLAPVHHDATTITFHVGMTYAEVEREMLLKTLEHFGNDRTRTAEARGVRVRTTPTQLARRRAHGAGNGSAAR